MKKVIFNFYGTPSLRECSEAMFRDTEEIPIMGTLTLRHKFLAYFMEDEEVLMEKYINSLSSTSCGMYIRHEILDCNEKDTSFELIGSIENVDVYNILNVQE